MTRKQLKSFNPFKAAQAVKARCGSALVSLQVKAISRAARIIADRHEVHIDSIVCRLSEEVDARAIASEMNHGEVARYLKITASDVAGAFSVEDIAECFDASDFAECFDASEVASEIDSIELAGDVADQFMGDILNGVSEMLDWGDMDYRKLAASLLAVIQNPESEDS